MTVLTCERRSAILPAMGDAGACAPDGARDDARRALALAAEADVDTDATAEGVTLMDLEPGDCRWPVNDGSPFLFCAEPAATGGPYCACHAALAVGAGTRREREAVRFARNQVRRETLSTSGVE